MGTRNDVTIPSNPELNVVVSCRLDTCRNELNLDAIDLHLVKSVRKSGEQRAGLEHSKRDNRTCSTVLGIQDTKGVRGACPNHESRNVALPDGGGILPAERPSGSSEPEGHGIRAGIPAAAGVVTCHLRRSGKGPRDLRSWSLVQVAGNIRATRTWTAVGKNALSMRLSSQASNWLSAW